MKISPVTRSKMMNSDIHGPDRQPGGPHHFVVVGQSGGCAGENVSHTATSRTRPGRCPRPSPPRRTGSRGRPGSPRLRRPWPSGRGSGRPAPCPTAIGLVNGNQCVKDVVLTAALPRHGHHHQESLLGVKVGLAVQLRVLEGVLPALGKLLLASLHPVGVGDPLAGVGWRRA